MIMKEISLASWVLVLRQRRWLSGSHGQQNNAIGVGGTELVCLRGFLFSFINCLLEVHGHFVSNFAWDRDAFNHAMSLLLDQAYDSLHENHNLVLPREHLQEALLEVVNLLQTILIICFCCRLMLVELFSFSGSSTEALWFSTSLHFSRQLVSFFVFAFHSELQNLRS